MTRAATTAAVLLLLAGSLQALLEPVAAADLVATNGDWKAYRHGSGSERMCFAVTRATEAGATPAERDPPYLYVTAWPAAGVRTEISVILGFPLRRGEEISVEIGGQSFTLLADGDRAFVGDAAEEQKLLEAMRRGRTMIVEAETPEGQTSKDTFSLSGLTSSVQAIASACS